jgi:energy-coupling factor transporter ATP-binding protein EcfA2
VIRRLDIENFRRFEKYSLTNLGQVNLLVGDNNCGKTTVLEAIELLNSPLHANPLLQIVDREFSTIPRPSRRGAGLTAPYLFHEGITEGTTISLVGNTDLGTTTVQLTHHLLTNSDAQEYVKHGWDKLVVDRNGMVRRELAPTLEVASILRIIAASSDGNSTQDSRWINELAINTEGRVTGQGRGGGTSSFLTSDAAHSRCWAIPMNGTSESDLIDSLEKIAGNPEEDLVVETVKRVIPELEQIRPTSSPLPTIYAKVANQVRRVPLATYGDGVWRILGLAIGFVHSRGGVLLVDEIDSGIYYERLPEMWRFVLDAAKEHHVQVFATTHSSDCVDALAEICDSERDESGDVSLQRIDPMLPESVWYSEAEIVAAREHRIEVR